MEKRSSSMWKISKALNSRHIALLPSLSHSLFILLSEVKSFPSSSSRKYIRKKQLLSFYLSFSFKLKNGKLLWVLRVWGNTEMGTNWISMNYFIVVGEIRRNDDFELNLMNVKRNSSKFLCFELKIQLDKFIIKYLI